MAACTWAKHAGMRPLPGGRRQRERSAFPFFMSAMIFHMVSEVLLNEK
jgi:hypothetical protein